MKLKLWNLLSSHDKTALLKGLKNKFKLYNINVWCLIIDYKQNGMIINNKYSINFEELIDVDFFKYENKVNKIIK